MDQKNNQLEAAIEAYHRAQDTADKAEAAFNQAHVRYIEARDVADRAYQNVNSLFWQHVRDSK